MEIRLKDILFWLGLLSLFPLGVSLFVTVTGASSPPSAGPVPPLGPTLGQPPPSHVAATEVAVAFADDSAAWDWENPCEEALARFVTGHGYPLTHLTVTLVDNDDTLPLGVAVPGPAAPDALAFTACEGDDTHLAYQVTVGAGMPGVSLDTALSVALASGVQEHFRPRSRELWDQGTGWNWADFQPLIEQEGETWRSTCLALATE